MITWKENVRDGKETKFLCVLNSVFHLDEQCPTYEGCQSTRWLLESRELIFLS